MYKLKRDIASSRLQVCGTSRQTHLIRSPLEKGQYTIVHMSKVHNLLVVPLVSLATALAASSHAQTNALTFKFDQMVTDDEIQINVGTYQPKDLSLVECAHGTVQNGTPCSVLPSVMTGGGSSGADGQAWINEFSQFAGAGNEPYADCPNNDQVYTKFRVGTFAEPYEYYPGRHIDFLRARSPHNDYVADQLRLSNGRLAKMLCPLRLGVADPTTTQLKQTFGRHITLTQSFPGDVDLILLMDNYRNPYRWLGPVNELHPSENSSMYLSLFPQDPAQIGRILRDYRDDGSNVRILLKYDIELAVTDLRHIQGEWDGTVSGVRGGSHTLVHQMQERSKDLGLTDHWFNKKLERRLEDPFVHASIGLVFGGLNAQGAGGQPPAVSYTPYRNQEFVIYDKNYRSIVDSDFRAVRNATINHFVEEGGVSGISAWARMPLTVLKTYWGNQIVKSGTTVQSSLAVGTETVNLTGEIDITEYYKISHGHNFFPGKTGQFRSSVYKGFNENTTADGNVYNPSEKHDLDFISFLFEMNGPFKVNATVRNIELLID